MSQTDEVAALRERVAQLEAALQTREPARALIASESRYRALFEHAMDAIFVADRETGMVVDANRQGLLLSGYSLEEIRGLHQTQLHPQEQEQQARAAFARGVTRPGEFVVEIFLQDKYGQRIPVEISAHSIRDSDQRVLHVGIFRDIREHVQAEARLRWLNAELEQRVAERTRELAELYQNTPDGIFVADRQGRLVQINRAGCAMLGYPEAELRAMSVEDVLAPEELEAGRAHFREVAEHGRASGVLRCRRKNGAACYLMIDAVELGANRLLGFCKDVTALKQMELALRESEKRFRSMFDNAPLGMALIGADGKVLLSNSALRRIVGYSEEELAAMPFTAFTHPDDAARDLAEYQALFGEGGDSYAAEKRYLHKSRRIVWAHLTVAIIRDGQGRPLYAVGMAEDISERRRIEEDLRRTARDLEEAQRIAQLGSWKHELETGEVLWSAEVFRIFEHDPALFGASYQAFLASIHPDDRERVDRAYRDSVANHTPYQVDHRLLMADGRIKYVQERGLTFYRQDGSPLRSAGTVQDISRLYQVERELRESEARYHELFDRSPNGIAVYRAVDQGRDFIFVDFNRGGERIDQVSRQNLLERRVTEVFPGVERFGLLEVFRQVWRSGEPQQHPLAFYQDQRLLGWRENYVYKLPSGEIVAIYEDVTARKQAEETLQQANQELARAARLKDEFMASMSHELRTPLTGILNLSEALQENVYGPLGPEQANALRTIEQSGRHLLNLINDILDLSKIEAGQLKLQADDCELAELCQASWQLLNGLAVKKSLRYAFRLNPPDLHIQADSRRLKQMLVNLLGNAIKFTPDGGQVGLDVIGDQASGVVRFCVWDTGIGIAEDRQAEIFHPFTQVDSSLGRHYEGTGLGLALVRRMAELHQGRITLSSQPGQGSRFTLELPWRAPPFQPFPPGAPDCPGERCLLAVEDPPGDRDHLVRYLNELGIAYVFNATGENVVEQAAGLSPCLVLLDTCLPGADGWQVLADLKADSRTQSIPVILTSLAEERKRAYGLGAAAYLVKPFGLDELKYELHRALPCLLGCDRPPFPQASARAEAFLLLAEDNPILAQSYLKYLERRHYRLTLAGSGAEVLALARQNPPDLVLMDIQMPDMDGLEAIRALRAGPEPRLARVPIIALTGLAMPGDREHCLNAGANAYLSKPVSLKQLAETIEALLAERGNTG